MQDDDPVEAVYVPAAQLVQPVAPALDCEVPVEHPVQLERPVVAPYVPTSQLVHADAPAAENCPWAQLVHTVAPMLEPEKVPMLQAKQFDEPVLT